MFIQINQTKEYPMTRINLPKSLSSIPFIAYVMTIEEFSKRYRMCTEYQREFKANNINTVEMAEQIDEGDQVIEILSAANVDGEKLIANGNHRSVAIKDRKKAFIVIEYQLKSMQRLETIIGEINNFDNPRTSWKLRHNAKFIPVFDKLKDITIEVKETKQKVARTIDYADLIKCVISAIALKRPAGINDIKKNWGEISSKITDDKLEDLTKFINMYHAFTKESLDNDGQINFTSGVVLASWCRFFKFRKQFQPGNLLLFISKNQKIITKQLSTMEMRDSNCYAFWSYIFAHGFKNCEETICDMRKKLLTLGNDFPRKVKYNG
jgi:hypothetical protein